MVIEEKAEAAAWRRFQSRLHRAETDRVLAGVAGGVARQLGLPSPYVRAGFVVLSFAGGVGAVLYLVLLGLTVDAVRDEVAEPLPDRQRLAVALMFLGSLLGLRGLDLWFGDSLVWPVLLVSFGTAAVWRRRDSSLGMTAQDVFSAGSRGRMLAGGVLMLAGLLLLFASSDVLGSLTPVIIAASVTAVGFLLVFGPWVWNLANDLAEERRSRIRNEEKADMAAHLHDSVLQTLALIQRSDDPRRMVTLARAQERELRAWLYEADAGTDGSHLAGSLKGVAARIEGASDVPVEVVTVGDAPMNDRYAALVAAVGEAITNAARHSGAPKVTVYSEITGPQAEVWVSDQGSGFDPDDIDGRRQGITGSIRRRMVRHGGRVNISSERGEGTEVHLAMPAEPPARSDVP